MKRIGILAISIALAIIASCAAIASAEDISESDRKYSAATIFVSDDSSTIQDTVNATLSEYTSAIYNRAYKENAVDKKSTPGQIATTLSSSVTILDHAMCKAVDEDGNPIDRTSEFYTTDERAILWYNLFVPKNLGYNETVRWYDPDGNLEDEGTNENQASSFSYESRNIHYFSIAGSPRANKPGRWHVTLYWNGVLKFTEYFTISAPEKPDLIITDIYEKDNKIYYKIKNQGTAKAGSSHSYLYIDSSKKAEDYVGSISAGSTRTEHFDFIWECSGSEDTIKVCADAKSDVTESGGSNNCREEKLSCPDKPDLIITDIYEKDNKTYYKIKNQGTANAGSSYSYLYIDGSKKAEDDVGSISAGSTSEEYFDFSWECSGSEDTIKVCADATNKVSESDEMNNCKSVTWRLFPDILVSPTKFNETLPQNTTWNGTMSIGNSGEGVLNFAIGISYAEKQTGISIASTHIQPGWPKLTGDWVVSSPALGDIDVDGDIEIVVGSRDNKVYAWHHDGTIVTGWPKITGGGVWSSPALGDIDGDGDIEIVVGSRDDKVYAWHHDGTIVTGWPKITGGEVWSSPAIGDIDGDGEIEIVVGSYDDKVYAWHHDGILVTGWPKITGDEVYSSPALGDIDGNGDLEIVVGSEDNKVYAWHHDGILVTGWPKITGDKVYSSPALGDIDGNGDLEIVVGSKDDKVYAWHHDGTIVTGWPKITGGSVLSSPALGDIDGDGDIEIVVGSKDNKVYAWHHDSTIVTGWPKITGDTVYSSPALGDIDGDGDIEIVVGSKDNKVYAWHHDGILVTGWPKITGGEVRSSPALGDIDGDGDIEVVVGSHDDKVYAWDCSGTYDPSNIEWGTFHHDVRHTGVYGAMPPKGWLSVTPTSGVVDPSSQTNLDVTINTTGLAVGEYNANISITTNDPDERKVVVPVHLTVSPKDITTVTVKNPTEVSEGGNFTATVSADNINALAIFIVELTYDPSVIKLTNVERGSSITTSHWSNWNITQYTDTAMVIALS